MSVCIRASHFPSLILDPRLGELQIVLRALLTGLTEPGDHNGVPVGLILQCRLPRAVRLWLGKTILDALYTFREPFLCFLRPIPYVKAALLPDGLRRPPRYALSLPYVLRISITNTSTR